MKLHHSLEDIGLLGQESNLAVESEQQAYQVDQGVMKLGLL